MLLPRIWLRWSIDVFIEALPSGGDEAPGIIGIRSGSAVQVGPEFRRAEAGWVAGIAAMARDGVGIILDDVFLGGSVSQQRLSVGLTGLQILWVGVRCDRDIAVAREQRRPDRVTGMAAAQADAVHLGVHYKVDVDSTAASPTECAHMILSALATHSA